MDFSKVLNLSKKLGIEEIELYSKKSVDLSFEYFDLELDQRSQTSSSVFCLRGVYNNNIATVYLENDSEAAILKALEKIKESASLIEKKDSYYIYEGDKDYAKISEDSSNANEFSTEYKLALVKKISEKLKSSTEYFFHSQASYSESRVSVEIKNSNGLNLSREYTVSYIVGSLICKKDEETKDNYDYKLIKKLEEFNVDEFVSGITNGAVSKFNASSLPSKAYRVVLQNDVVCDLLGVYSSIFSAQNVKEHTSFLENKLNEKIFGDNISIEDDPFLNEAPYQVNFDDEGVATSKTMLVENGVLKTYLHNLSTADYFKTKSTGNGFKASVASNVSVTPSNLVLKAGNISFAELLEKVENGVLITSITGLHAGVNVISGDFNVQCSGYKIENGKKTSPVTLIVLSGKFQELFNNVSAIANDSYYSLGGLCAPSIYVKEMNISGN